jgi:hypothetical protein
LSHAVTLLTCIQELPGWTSAETPTNSDWYWFSSISLVKLRDSITNWVRHILPTTHSTIRRYRVWANDSVVN